MQDRKPASRSGPAVRVRFRSKTELAAVKRAARYEGLSLNTFVVTRASVAAATVIEQAEAENKSNAAD